MTDTTLRQIPFSEIQITGGFWKKKQEMARKATVRAVYDRFAETGRFDALKCDWTEGKPNKPHFFWDSDVAKWLEGAIYIQQTHPSARLQKKIDTTIDTFLANQGEDGYFNSYFTTVAPEDRLSDIDKHELYCAGHWMEAAVAHIQATGDDRFLKGVEKFADYIERRFLINKDVPFEVPGHEEIELALLRMYDCTKKKKYLEMALHFLNLRGAHPQSVHPEREWVTAAYCQNHLPVRQQTEAVGHAVRAVYLYTAMADAAAKTGDEALKNACERLWRDITEKKMFITGSIGSSARGEAFTVEYDLCNLLAYSETCASIGLIYFAQKMLSMDADSRYSDVIEQALYNCFLASTSLDGMAFYYENPQEIVPYLHTRDAGSSAIKWPKMERSKVFTCSCCPPNIVRMLPSVGNYVASEGNGTVYVHQYMQCEIGLSDGKRLKIDTRYPQNGTVTLTLTGGDGRLAVRVPGWCKNHGYPTAKGYTYLEAKDGVPVSLSFPMKVQFIEARPEVIFNCGRVAVRRGPVLYCAEQADNGPQLRDLILSEGSRFKQGVHPDLGVPTLTGKAFRRTWTERDLYRERNRTLTPVPVTLIPYYAMANRGEGEMLLWFQIQ